MGSKLPNYLRTCRKKSYLSQDEVAFLLGCRSGAKVSKYEKFHRKPVLETALAYEILLNKPIGKLFPGICSKIEHDVIKRARVLARRLQDEKPTRVIKKKLGTLNELTSLPRCSCREP